MNIFIIFVDSQYIVSTYLIFIRREVLTISHPNFIIKYINPVAFEKNGRDKRMNNDWIRYGLINKWPRIELWEMWLLQFRQIKEIR